MDQLKTILAWIKTNHFWLLTALAIALVLLGWRQGASQLASETDSNKRVIDTEFQNARTISSRSFHPNDDVNRVQAQENRQLAAKVRETWQNLYDRQVNEVLIWPRQLRSDFAREVAKLNFGDDILPYLRDDYLNYIQKRFPDLPKIIDALEVESEGGASRGRGGFGGEFGGEFGGGGGFGGGMRLTEEQLAAEDYLVLWHDQEEIRLQLAWEKRPSSLAIWVTQEDLWVYETLLKAIAATNKAAGADRYSNAAVRDIWAMQVGKNVTRKSGGTRIFVPQDESSGGGFGGEFGGGEFGGGEFGGGEFGGGEFGGGEFGGGEFGGGEFGEGEGDEKTELLAGRYVDESGLPMASPLDEGFSFGTEYKRLPIRLVLRMDQRWLQLLITELANAPLQVEVQEVRINPEDDFGGGGSGRRASSRGGRFGGGGSNDEILAFDREPHVREQLVIEGLVYIFYPPDETVLEVPTDGADLAAADY